jgi:RHS repeat-associated protein
MLAQTVTKGSAPTLSVNVNPATNRITTGGYSYDSNGNLTAMPNLTLSYDIENRLVQAVGSGTERYVYDPGNQRVWKEGKVYFYGVEGNLLGTYGDGSNTDYNVYFGGKLIWQEAAAGLAAHRVNADRLDSTVKHFPYGEEPTTTSQDRSKFATYYRDATTALDYAQNRYYARTIGRFTSPDPSEPGDPSNPASWNLYAYVEGDPVNSIDPEGLSSISFSTGYISFMPILDGLGSAPSQIRFGTVSLRVPAILIVAPPVAPSTPQPQMTSSGNATIDKVRQQIYDADSDRIFGDEILDCMAGLETGLTWNPNVLRKSGDLGGLYQFGRATWTYSTSAYAYSAANVHSPTISTLVAIEGLYKKLRGVVGRTNFDAYVNSKVAVPRPLLVQAISAWESTKGGTMYGSEVLNCVDDMKKGDFAAATKHIQSFLNYRRHNPIPK